MLPYVRSLGQVALPTIERRARYAEGKLTDLALPPPHASDACLRSSADHRRCYAFLEKLEAKLSLEDVENFFRKKGLREEHRSQLPGLYYSH